jgi:predicted phage tail protein
MDLKEFSRVSDSSKKLNERRASVEQQKSAKKMSDAKESLRRKIRDSESDEELIATITEAAEELPVSEVLTTVVEVLSPIVEKLNAEVADARRAVASMRKRLKYNQQAISKTKPKMDSRSKRMLISRMKDDETSLEDLKQEAVDLLESFDPASVIEVIIEAIPPVVESIVSSTNDVKPEQEQE